MVNTYVVDIEAGLLAGALGAPTRLEVGADTFTRALAKLGELARARDYDGQQ